jgi:FkbM family methyltransferase
MDEFTILSQLRQRAEAAEDSLVDERRCLTEERHRAAALQRDLENLRQHLAQLQHQRVDLRNHLQNSRWLKLGRKLGLTKLDAVVDQFSQPDLTPPPVSTPSSDRVEGRSLTPIRWIFDVGLHVGQDTDFYLAKGFHVLAIEANPVLIAAARAKFAEAIQQGRLLLLNLGITPEPGEFTFYVNKTHSEWSSFVKELGEREGFFEEVSVPCVAMDEVFAAFGVPYYLKVDIEGGDIDVVKPLVNLPVKPQYVSVENGNGGLLECLHDAGYDRFKFINQAQVNQMKCPQPALEGHDIDYTFPFGASGPFGEETIGQWLTYEEIARVIDAYWQTPGLDATVHGWFDLHAKLSTPL